LPKGAKCKWQKIKLTLQVPIGKKIKVKNVEHDDSRFDDFTNDIYLARTESCKDYDSENDPRHVFMYKTRTWRMGQNGLLCDDCTPEELKRFTINTEKDEDDNGNNNDEENLDSNGNDNDNNDSDDSTSININGDDAKIKLDENGLSIKSNKKGENVEIKIDEDGFKVKKNGKTIRPNEN
jgi:hypothetical protein